MEIIFASAIVRLSIELVQYSAAGAGLSGPGRAANRLDKDALAQVEVVHPPIADLTQRQNRT
ncbi:hypothetical protein [Aureimonas sp. Leaf427]|uniref:hypothetical protein n=1 Tax=Aureimonas sp. Leaf427 TaxID=1736375 RepID=UPI001AEBCC54|nr:hypothetical protein [Aureimonas sp. Leaf427]